MTNFKAIAAVAENGVIGRGLEIPWRISEDFRHFKRTTLGGVLLMGRRTWESLGSRPLPGRENAVITSWPGEVSGRARSLRSKRPPPPTTATRVRCGFAGVPPSTAPPCRCARSSF